MPRLDSINGAKLTVTAREEALGEAKRRWDTSEEARLAEERRLKEEEDKKNEEEED